MLQLVVSSEKAILLSVVNDNANFAMDHCHITA